MVQNLKFLRGFIVITFVYIHSFTNRHYTALGDSLHFTQKLCSLQLNTNANSYMGIHGNIDT